MRFCPRCGLVYRAGRAACALDGESLAEGSYDPLPGRELGGFTVLDLVSEGRTSRVYAAQDAQKRPVILKVATGDMATDRELMRRWILEASLAELRDPSLFVRVLGSRLTEEGIAYVALERGEGPSLRDLLAGQGVEDGIGAATIAADLAAALTLLHKKDRAYGCLEPRKVLLERVHDRWRAKLFEGGLGELGAAAPEDPGFSAPEGGPPSRRRDLFALGGILRALVAKLPPSDRERVALLAIADNLSDRDPSRRPESAAEVRRSLGELGHAGPSINTKLPEKLSLRPSRDSARPSPADRITTPPAANTDWPRPSASLAPTAPSRSMVPLALVGVAIIGVLTLAVVQAANTVDPTEAAPLKTAAPAVVPSPTAEAAPAVEAELDQPTPAASPALVPSPSAAVAEAPKPSPIASAAPVSAKPSPKPSPSASPSSDGTPGFTELDIQIGKALAAQGLVWDDIARLEPERAQRWGRWYRKSEVPAPEVLDAHFRALEAAVGQAAKLKRQTTVTSTR